MDVIYDILEKASVTYPDKEAFVFKGKRYTYGEINLASAKLARFLTDEGMTKGDRVAIFSTKCCEEIIAIFAILRAGGVFVHINPHFREDQLSHVVADCDIKVMLVSESRADILQNAFSGGERFRSVILMTPGMKPQFPNAVELETILDEYSTALLPDAASGPSENDPAAIIYTSGSTGMPKGIVVTEKIFHDSTVASVQVLENNPDDRLISVTPLSFDGALSQLFTTVYVGGTLVLNDSTFPKDIVRIMIDERITGFHAVPSFWRMLLQRFSPFSKNQYPDLRYVSIIGESFPPHELHRLRSVLTNTRFYMMYGTTEAFRSTYLDPAEFERKFPSVGKPFPGVDISIIDEQGAECAPDETGEIVHKGAFVSPGYWNDPQRTAAVFRNGALYTGDLGKRDVEGYIFFVGRKDTMIKTMGYRVSPDEIEKCVYKLNGIKEAAAIPSQDGDMGTKIKLVVALAGNSPLSEKDIVDHCRACLPYYMIPHKVEFMEEIPKTGTFKINKSQLVPAGNLS